MTQYCTVYLFSVSITSLSSFFTFPSITDFQHKFTVQASPTMDKRKNLINNCASPPASPTIIPRLRAIQCKKF